MNGADYSSLVERLRKRGRHVVTKRVPLIPQMDEEQWVPDALCQEAAEAIEALLFALGIVASGDGDAWAFAANVLEIVGANKQSYPAAPS